MTCYKSWGTVELLADPYTWRLCVCVCIRDRESLGNLLWGQSIYLEQGRAFTWSRTEFRILLFSLGDLLHRQQRVWLFSKMQAEPFKMPMGLLWELPHSPLKTPRESESSGSRQGHPPRGATHLPCSSASRRNHRGHWGQSRLLVENEPEISLLNETVSKNKQTYRNGGKYSQSWNKCHVQ